MQLENELKSSQEKMQEYEQELTLLEEQIRLREIAVSSNTRCIPMI